MPEIKHNFTGGKMNKDLDERLIPNGQYTDAMNIQVSTSEGSDVGTVQNILGNRKMSSNLVDEAVSGGVVVCSLADEKNDRLYYFVWTPSADYILEYSRGASKPIPVFVDTNKDTLRFREDIIVTGVNIIDDMLFWTDNNTEPKKINITRCKEGTPNITTHTKLVNQSQGLTNIDIKEKDMKFGNNTISSNISKKRIAETLNVFSLVGVSLVWGHMLGLINLWFLPLTLTAIMVGYGSEINKDSPEKTSTLDL